MPNGLIQVWFSASWPLTAASCVLIVLMWHELVTSSSINVRTGFLTTSRIPAAVIISLVVVVEWATACLRAVGLTGFVLFINAYADPIQVAPPVLFTFFFAPLQGAVFCGIFRMFLDLRLCVHQGVSLLAGCDEAHRTKRHFETRLSALPADGNHPHPHHH